MSSPDSDPVASDADTVDLALPERVVSRVEARLPRTDFDTPEEYVAYAMEEVLARVEADTEGDHTGVDENEVRDRLQSLGYLDE